MFDTLYHYLVLHRRVSLPGVGTISLHRQPAQYNVVEKAFSPPAYSFHFNSAADDLPKKMLDWVAKVRNVAEWDAVKLVNDFSFEINRQLNAGNEVKWDPVGVLRKDSMGNVVLESNAIVADGEEPVAAEKVIRENAQHVMLVGERERTTSEMEVMLMEPARHRRKNEVHIKQPRQVSRNLGMTLAIILMVLTLLFIGFYFSEKGLLPTSAGKQLKMDF